MALSYVFLTAPPGTGLGVAAGVLRQHLTTDHCGGRADLVQFEDVEERLPQPFRDFIEAHPKGEVIRRWGEALTSCLSALRPETEIRVVTGHLTLYNYVRSEFYTAAHSSLLSNAAGVLSHVVMLIDDVFDMYTRLSAPDQVYDAVRRVQEAEDSVWGQLDLSGPPLFSARDRALLLLEVGVSDLTALLGWRRSEMIHAEALAISSGVDLTVLGVKHPVEVGSAVLSDPRGATRVYLSHPISRPRREQSKAGQWPSVVHRFNSLSLELANRGIAAVMPTAIDEYRLAPRETLQAVECSAEVTARGAIGDGDEPVAAEALESSGEFLDLYRRMPGYLPRWPHPAAESVLINGSAPLDVAIDRLDWAHEVSPAEFRSVSASVSLQVGGQLRALENAIEQQVPFRDHLLVHTLPHLLVFRPLYGSRSFSKKQGVFRDGGGTFSVGVRREIVHWADAATRTHVVRRAAFVHAWEDVRKLYRVLQGRVQSDGTRYSLTMLARQYLVDSEKYSDVDADTIVTTGRVRSDLLSRVRFTEEQMLSHREEAYRQAGIRYFVSQLSSIEQRHDAAVGVFLVQDGRTLPSDLFRHLEEFFRVGTKPDPAAEIEKALDMSLADWVSGVMAQT